MADPRWSLMIARAVAHGLAPREFWALSLREWRALFAAADAAGLDRAAFEALARRFPDQHHQETDNGAG